MLDANRGDAGVAAFLEHTDRSGPPVYADEAGETIAVTGDRDYLLGPTIDRAGIWVGEVRHEIGQAVGQYIEDNPGVGIALQIADAGFAIAGPARYIGGQVLSHFEDQAAGFIADQMRSDPAHGRRMWAPDLADAGGHGFVFAGSVILGGLAALRVRVDPNSLGSNGGNIRIGRGPLFSAAQRRAQVVNVDGYRVGPHGAVRERVGGLETESHHGMNDAWAQQRYGGDGYFPEDAPTISLPVADHRRLSGVLNTWRAEQRRASGNPRWRMSDATPEQIRDLAVRQMDVARVPTAVRTEYFRQWDAYIARLQQGGG